MAVDRSATAGAGGTVSAWGESRTSLVYGSPPSLAISMSRALAATGVRFTQAPR